MIDSLFLASWIDDIFSTFSDATLYFSMAVVGTLLFSIRIIMMLFFGLDDGGDFDVDVDMDTGGFEGHMVDPDVRDVALHADGVAAVGGRRARLLHVPHVQVLEDDVRRVADVDAELVEQRTIAGADDGDVADVLELDPVGCGVAASGHLARVAVIDRALDLDDDRLVVAGSTTDGFVDLGPGAGPDDLPTLASSGSTVGGGIPVG